jgi:uncharacterized membrane protein
MRILGDIGKQRSNPMAIVFPAALLILTPIFDIVFAITFNIAWHTIAFWCAFVGVSLALVVFMPALLDWLALDRGTRARRESLPSLALQALGIVAFVASVTLRLRGHGTPSPLAFALADGGVCLLAMAALVAAPRAPHLSRRPLIASRGM